MQVMCIAAGLLSLTQKLVDKIVGSRNYIKFVELPPVTQPREGQLVRLHAADLVQARKTIPDFAIRGQ